MRVEVALLTSFVILLCLVSVIVVVVLLPKHHCNNTAVELEPTKVFTFRTSGSSSGSSNSRSRFRIAVLQRLHPITSNNSNNNNSQWCLQHSNNSNNMEQVEYYSYTGVEQPWAYLLELLLMEVHTHIMFIDSDMYFQFSKPHPHPFTQLLEQAGDVNMILARDEHKKNLVNLRAFVLQCSPWSIHKIKECHKHCVHVDTVTKRSQTHLFHDVNTSYRCKSLTQCSEQVDQGLPYAMTDIIVFHEHAFNSSKSPFLTFHQPQVLQPVLVYPWTTTVPGFLFLEKNLHKLPAVDGLNTNTIPKRMVQTMETTLTELDRYTFSVKKWQELNPEYDYIFFDALDCRDMIKQHFPKDVLDAYNKLIPGAFKCDLWRLCYLYLYGGVYVDCQTMPYKPLREVLKPDTTFCSVDVGDFAVWQGFLCSVPRHPLLLVGIQDIVNNVLNEQMVHVFQVTGPYALGISRNKWLQRPEKTWVEAPPSVPHEQWYYHRKNDLPFICDEQGNRVLVNKYFHDKTVPCNQKEGLFINYRSGKEKYWDAYHNGRVYKKLY